MLKTLHNFNRTKPFRGFLIDVKPYLSNTCHWHLTGYLYNEDGAQDYRMTTSRVVSAGVSDEYVLFETKNSLYAVFMADFDQSISNQMIVLSLGMIIDTLPEEDADTPELMAKMYPRIKRRVEEIWGCMELVERTVDADWDTVLRDLGYVPAKEIIS